jgi:DNA-binding ferritin-like protein
MEKRTLKKMEQSKKLSRPSYSDDSEMENKKMESMEYKVGVMKRTPEMQKVDKMTSALVQELMNAATSFHRLHLRVTGEGSFAQHSALNEIYDALPGLADTIAEGYQGACEVILSYTTQAPIDLPDVESAIEYMREIKDKVNQLQAVMPHTEIINELDNTKLAIDSAKYKLIFLA